MSFKPQSLIPGYLAKHPMLSLLKSYDVFDINDPRNILMLPIDHALSAKLEVPQYVEHPLTSYVDEVAGQLDLVWNVADQKAAQSGDQFVLSSLREDVYGLCDILRVALSNGDLIMGAAAETSGVTNTSSDGPGIFFLLFENSPSFDPDTVLSNILKIEPSRSAEPVNNFANETLVSFEEHAFLLMAVEWPLPAEEISTALDRTNWGHGAKEKMRRHASHIACMYSGTSADVTEHIVAALKLAFALVPYGLSGFVRFDAGIAIPADVLPIMTKADMLKESREDVPVGVWTGFEKFERPDGRIWYLSRGFHLWGKPDLASLGAPQDAPAIRVLFDSLLNHMRNNGTVFQTGDTASLGDNLLSFSSLKGNPEALNGRHETLVVTSEKRGVH